MSRYDDRRAVDEDEKQRILDLTTYKFNPPASGIQEGDLYYYACNPAWAKLIEGHLSWLASPAAWPEAENEDYIAIQQILIFLRRVEFPMPPDFDCGDVEDCLETSTIINNINETIINIEKGGSNAGNPANVDLPANEGPNHEDGNEDFFEPDDCGPDDMDRLWGAVSTFVDFVDSTNLDFFQKIAVYTSRAKLLSTVISAIPLFGLLPFDEAIEGAAQLADFFQVEYLGSVTTEGLYQLKCDLFCEAVANGCFFDVNTGGQYFLDNMGIAGLSDASSFENWVEHIASGLTITGNEVFCFMAAFQMALASLGERFDQVQGMKAYTKAGQAGALSPNSEWQAWCEECPVEDGDWTLVLDFANDYVKEDEDEIVYRNAFNLLRTSSAFSTTGTASLTNQYALGIVYHATANQFNNKELRVSNAGALFKQLQINALKDDGTASQFSIDTDSNTYNPPPRLFNLSGYTWSSAVGVANVAGTPGAVTRIALNFSQVLANQSCTGYLRYIRFTGTGERPQFI